MTIEQRHAEIIEKLEEGVDATSRLESAVAENTKVTRDVLIAMSSVSRNLKLQALIPASAGVVIVSSWFFETGKLDKWSWILCLALAVSPYFPAAENIASKISAALPGPKSGTKLLILLLPLGLALAKALGAW